MMIMIMMIMKVSVGHSEAGIDLGEKAVGMGATMVNDPVYNPANPAINSKFSFLILDF